MFNLLTLKLSSVPVQIQCRIDLIVKYKQFVLFKFKFNLLSNETQFYSQVEKSWFQFCCEQSSLKKPIIR